MDEENHSPPGAMDGRRRRSSILKPAKLRNPLTEIDQLDDTTSEKQTRKVRFSSNFVKPFTTQENTTIWDRTYEEPIEKSEDTPQSCNDLNMCESAVSDTPKQNSAWKNEFPTLADIVGDSFGSNAGLLDISDYIVTNHTERKENVELKKSEMKKNTLIHENMNLTLTTEFQECFSTKTASINKILKVETIKVKSTIVQEAQLEHCPNKTKSNWKNKTILDQSEMEFTQAVPVSEIQESLATQVLQKHQRKTPSERRKTILTPADMEFTEAVPDLDTFTQQDQHQSGNGRRKTILIPADMELTEPVPDLSLCAVIEQQKRSSNKTILKPVDMEFTEAVPNFSPPRPLPQAVSTQPDQQNPSIERRKIPADMELTQTVASECDNDVDDNKQQVSPSDRRKTILNTVDMDFTEAVPNFSPQSDQQNPSNARRKTILIPADMELTQSAEGNVLEDNGHERQVVSERRKTILASVDMEFTEAVPDFSPLRPSEDRPTQDNPLNARRKTILIPTDMELTQTFPDSPVDVETNNLENDSNKDAMQCSKNVNQNRDIASDRRKTILISEDMEFTEAVPSSPLIQQSSCGRRKTILIPADMELTEPVPEMDAETKSVQKFSDRRKTILTHLDMEMTEAVPDLTLSGPYLEEHTENPSCDRRKTISIPADMELTETVPDVDIGGVISEASSGRRKTILAPVDMEFTEAVPDFSPPGRIPESVHSNARRKTILVPADMELTEAVPDLSLILSKQPSSEKRKTIFNNVDMEFTEAVPDFSPSASSTDHSCGRRKTILVPTDMELTIPNLGADISTNNCADNILPNQDQHQRTILGHVGMEFTEAVPDFIQSPKYVEGKHDHHTEDQEVVCPGRRKTILIPYDMELTGVVPVNDLEVMLASGKDRDLQENLEVDQKGNDNMSIKSSFKDIPEVQEEIGSSINPKTTGIRSTKIEESESGITKIKEFGNGRAKIDESESGYARIEEINYGTERGSDLMSVQNNEKVDQEEVATKTPVPGPLQKSKHSNLSENVEVEKPATILLKEKENSKQSKLCNTNVEEVSFKQVDKGKHCLKGNNKEENPTLKMDSGQASQLECLQKQDKYMDENQGVAKKPNGKESQGNNQAIQKSSEDHMKLESFKEVEVTKPVVLKNQKVIILSDIQFVKPHRNHMLENNYENCPLAKNRQTKKQCLFRHTVLTKNHVSNIRPVKVILQSTRNNFQNDNCPTIKSSDVKLQEFQRPKKNLDVLRVQSHNQPASAPSAGPELSKLVRKVLNEQESLTKINASEFLQKNNSIDRKKHLEVSSEEDNHVLTESETSRIIRESMADLPEPHTLHLSAQASESLRQNLLSSRLGGSRFACIENAKAPTESNKMQHKEIKSFLKHEVNESSGFEEVLKESETSRIIRESMVDLPEVRNLHVSTKESESLLRSKPTVNDSLPAHRKNPQEKFRLDEQHQTHEESETSRIIRESMVDLPEIPQQIPFIKYEEVQESDTSRIIRESMVGLPEAATINLVTPMSSFRHDVTAYSPCVDDTQALINYNLSGKKAKSNFSKILAGDYHDVSSPCVKNFPLGLHSNSFKIFSDDSAVDLLVEKKHENYKCELEPFKKGKENKFGNYSYENEIGENDYESKESNLVQMKNEGKNKISDICDVDENRGTTKFHCLNQGVEAVIGEDDFVEPLDVTNSPDLVVPVNFEKTDGVNKADLEYDTSKTLKCPHVVSDDVTFEVMEEPKQPSIDSQLLHSKPRPSSLDTEAISLTPTKNFMKQLSPSSQQSSPIIVITAPEPRINTSSEQQNTSQTLNNLIGISNKTSLETSCNLLDDTSFHLLSESNEVNLHPTNEPELVQPDYSEMDNEEFLQHIPEGWDTELLGQLANHGFHEVYDRFQEDHAEFLVKLNELRILQRNVFREVEDVLKMEYVKPAKTLERTTFNFVGVIGGDHEFKSIEEQVQDQAKLCEIEYKIISIEDDVYKISTLHNTIVLVVTIDKDKGNVVKMDIVSRISDKADIISRYINSLFMERLKNTHIKSSVGEKYTIMTLLDYIHMNFQCLNAFDTDLIMLEMKYSISVQPDFKIVYSAASHRLMVAADVIIDCVDYNKIDGSYISVNVTFGHLNEGDIKNIANSCAKGLAFLRTFVEKVDHYFSSKEKTLCIK